jgi:hypothetical protein
MTALKVKSKETDKIPFCNVAEDHDLLRCGSASTVVDIYDDDDYMFPKGYPPKNGPGLLIICAIIFANSVARMHLTLTCDRSSLSLMPPRPHNETLFKKFMYSYSMMAANQSITPYKTWTKKIIPMAYTCEPANWIKWENSDLYNVRAPTNQELEYPCPEDVWVSIYSCKAINTPTNQLTSSLDTILFLVTGTSVLMALIILVSEYLREEEEEMNKEDKEEQNKKNDDNKERV